MEDETKPEVAETSETPKVPVQKKKRKKRRKTQWACTTCGSEVAMKRFRGGRCGVCGGKGWTIKDVPQPEIVKMDDEQRDAIKRSLFS